MASPHQLKTVTAVDGSDGDMYGCNTGNSVTPARRHGHRRDEVSDRHHRLHQPQQPHQFTANGVADHPEWQCSSRAFRCTACDCQFVSRKYLSMHMALHNMTAVEPPPATRRRALTGSAADQWSCPVCGKTFAQNSNFRNHVRTHSDERPYVCLTCMIGFKERYHLKKHVLFKHSPDQLDHACRQCGKRFKDLTAVRAHERTHSDARPYGCSRCDKTFKTSECLWHHEHRSKTCSRVASLEHGHEIKPSGGGSRRHRKRYRTQRCASPSQFALRLSTSESMTADVATLLTHVGESLSAAHASMSSSAAGGCRASDSSGVKPETDLKELLGCDIGCLWTTSMTSYNVTSHSVYDDVDLDIYDGGVADATTPDGDHFEVPSGCSDQFWNGTSSEDECGPQSSFTAINSDASFQTSVSGYSERRPLGYETSVQQSSSTRVDNEQLISRYYSTLMDGRSSKHQSPVISQASLESAVSGGTGTCLPTAVVNPIKRDRHLSVTSSSHRHVTSPPPFTTTFHLPPIETFAPPRRPRRRLLPT